MLNRLKYVPLLSLKAIIIVIFNASRKNISLNYQDIGEKQQYKANS